ncbi:hypothetical protein HPB51_008678 [Rhipicephalus microplus]|uniref:Uncharacterized protein n=1 Tax=Rhipicephalus microplus TaxID=6941 RepID=A0A9J6D580_RHIMP|nr:hypothetical protein HPB51_008678 [Rhipicephalus microplus]
MPTNASAMTKTFCPDPGICRNGKQHTTSQSASAVTELAMPPAWTPPPPPHWSQFSSPRPYADSRRYSPSRTASHAALLARINALEPQLTIAKAKARMKEREHKKLMPHLSSYINEDQFTSLHRSPRGTVWSKETLTKALKIRLSCGSRGYDMVKEVGQPLPSQRTLQRHIEHCKFRPGLLVDIMDSLAVKPVLARVHSVKYSGVRECSHSSHSVERVNNDGYKRHNPVHNREALVVRQHLVNMREDQCYSEFAGKATLTITLF